MRILLDTHIFLWAINDDNKLSKKARTIISGATEVFVSSATTWEIAIKVKIGKLDIEMGDLTNAISQSGFTELPITNMHAAAIITLPDLHRDHFDRILIAQALTEPLRLLSADKMLAQYSDLVELV